MNHDDAKLILGTLKAAYPKTFANLKPADANNMVALWTEMFADDPAKIVAAAVKSFIATDEKGYPPHIGAIKSHVVRITSPPQKSEMEAWAEVKQALCNSLYNSDQEFEKLDHASKRIVGSPSQLREWSISDIGTLDSVVASNFQRSYRAISKAQREQKALPPGISDVVNLLSERMSIESAGIRALPNPEERENET